MGAAHVDGIDYLLWRHVLAVAADLRHSSFGRAAAVSTIAAQTRATRSLTALNLGPLAALEASGAGLVAAIGVAVLGAFIVLERRREGAILAALGADTRQLRAGPFQEGALVVTASVGIGVPIGLLLGLLSVRVLGLFFTLPPPLLDVPVAELLVFVAVMAGASAAALGLRWGGAGARTPARCSASHDSFVG